MAATATRPNSKAEADGDDNAKTCAALLANGRKHTIRLVDINIHFICALCEGYFRDAHKIKECAHTFCSSCIRHFFWQDKRHNSCPTCNVSLGAKPWNSLVPDPAIQGLADKLLPSFVEREAAESKKFYADLGLKRKPDREDRGTDPESKRLHAVQDEDSQSSNLASPTKKLTSAEKFAFEMYPQRDRGLPLFIQLDDLKQPRMATESSFRIHQLRKYLAFVLKLPSPDRVEILCRGRPMGGEYSLAFIQRTIWNDANRKMILEYRGTLE